MLASIDQLYRADKASPASVLEQIKDIQDINTSNNWKEGYLHAGVLEVELLAQLSHFVEARQRYSELFPLLNESTYPVLKVRIDLVGLMLERAGGANYNKREAYNSLLTKAKAFKDTFIASSIIVNIAEEQYSHTYYNDAIQSFMLAFDLVKDTEYYEAIGRILSSTSNLYADIGDYEKALGYALQAFDLANEIKHPYGQSIVASNIGGLYTKLGRYEKAREYLSLSLVISAELNDDVGMSRTLQKIANVETAQKNWQQAIDVLQKAIPIFDKSANHTEIFRANVALAKSYFELGELALAQQYLETNETQLESINNRYSILSFYLLKANLQSKLQNYEEAYKALGNYTTLKVESAEQERQQELEKYQTQFDLEIKEATNQALLAENNLKELQFEKQKKLAELRLIMVVLSFSLLVIVCLLLIVISRNRNKFKQLALRDPLTQSPNRHAILHYAKSRISEAKRTGTPFSVCLIDLDKFKLINDTFGHEAGDKVLKAFVIACKNALRAQDRYGRYGGEEWLLIIENSERAHIETVFKRLRESFNAQAIQSIPSTWEITFSMGVSVFEAQNRCNLKELINLADEKLYQAKKNGRDQCVF